MRVRVSASAFYVFASTSMFQFSEINFFGFYRQKMKCSGSILAAFIVSLKY